MKGMIDKNLEHRAQDFEKNLAHAVEEDMKKPLGSLGKGVEGLGKKAGVICMLAAANPLLGVAMYAACVIGTELAVDMARTAKAEAKQLIRESLTFIFSETFKVALDAGNLVFHGVNMGIDKLALTMDKEFNKAEELMKQFTFVEKTFYQTMQNNPEFLKGLTSMMESMGPTDRLKIDKTAFKNHKLSLEVVDKDGNPKPDGIKLSAKADGSMTIIELDDGHNKFIRIFDKNGNDVTPKKKPKDPDDTNDNDNSWFPNPLKV